MMTVIGCLVLWGISIGCSNVHYKLMLEKKVQATCRAEIERIHDGYVKETIPGLSDPE